MSESVKLGPAAYDKPVLCITSDIDWAPEEAIAEVAQLVRDAGLKMTFFATHDSVAVHEAASDTCEIALHPNFNNCKGDFEAPLRELKAIYPNAVGARSHSLFISSRILELYMRSGLVYESNAFLPWFDHLRPYRRFQDLLSIPYSWADESAIYRVPDDLGVAAVPFSLDALRLDTPGLKVLNFHPIHVFMNTTDEAHYLRYKQHYKDAERLLPLRETNAPGSRTVFLELLEYVRANGIPTFTMKEIRDAFVAEVAS